MSGRGCTRFMSETGGVLRSTCALLMLNPVPCMHFVKCICSYPDICSVLTSANALEEGLLNMLDV